MALLQLTRVELGEVGILPGNVKMVSTNDLATITTAGYLNGIGNQLASVNLAPSDVIECLYNFNTSTGTGTYVLLAPSFSNGVVTLSQAGGGGGSGTVNAGLINQMAWYAAAGTAVSGLATIANGVLVTSAGSVPSMSTTLPSGLTIPGYATVLGVQQNSYIAGVDSGAADHYVLTMSPPISDYTNNAFIVFTPANTNTGASDVAIDGLPVRSMVKTGGAALVAGDVVVDVPCFGLYDAEHLRLEILNPQTVSGSSSPWSSGAGTNSAIGGDGTCTAAGTNALAYGVGNAAAAAQSIAFGNANTINSLATNAAILSGAGNSISGSGANSVICGGTSNGGGANASGILCGTNNSLNGCNQGAILNGHANNIQGDFSVVGGNTSTVNGNYAIGFGLNVSISNAANHNAAFGNGATSTQAGCFVWSDGNASGNQPSTSNQFVATAQNGFPLYGGNLMLMTAGQGLSVKSGSNCKVGTAVLVGGTVTVSNTSVTASSLILLTPQVAGGTLGNLSVGTVVAGTSFDINSSSALDTSTVGYMIVEQG